MLKVNRRSVDCNFVECGNGVVLERDNFKINFGFVHAGNKFVVLVENFHVANNQIACLVEVNDLHVIEIDVADFDGHAQRVGGNFFRFRQRALDDVRPL